MKYIEAGTQIFSSERGHKNFYYPDFTNLKTVTRVVGINVMHWLPWHQNNKKYIAAFIKDKNCVVWIAETDINEKRKN